MLNIFKFIYILSSSCYKEALSILSEIIKNLTTVYFIKCIIIINLKLKLVGKVFVSQIHD